MKKIFLVVLTAILLAGCATRTEYGRCVGVSDEKDPSLVYKVSVWNAFLGIVFIETIFVPLVIIVNELYCPVDKKTK